jgi:hypothetical protein
VLGGREIRLSHSYVYRTGYDGSGSKIIWKEHATRISNDPFHALDHNDIDIIKKAIETGLELPVGKEQALRFDAIVEKIISGLTYTI